MPIRSLLRRKLGIASQVPYHATDEPSGSADGSGTVRGQRQKLLLFENFCDKVYDMEMARAAGELLLLLLS